MEKEFFFLDASPLIDLIQARKDCLVGKAVKRFYSSAAFGALSDEPLVFELEELVIVLHYYAYSSMHLYLLEPERFHTDETLSFLSRNLPERERRAFRLREMPFPYRDRSIEDITVERLSEEWARGDDPLTGRDYFGAITVQLADGQQFHICGLDGIDAGYIKAWG